MAPVGANSASWCFPPTITSVCRIAAIEDQRVDAGNILGEALTELVRCVLPLAIIGAAREVAEASFAGHARFAESEEGDVLLVAGQRIDIRA